VVYELTDFGRELEAAVVPLARWGARMLGEPRPREIITCDSMIMALRTTFRPQAAEGVQMSFEVRLGEVVLHAVVDDGQVHVAAGRLPGADLVIESGPGLRAVLAGEVAPVDAIAAGLVRVQGDPALLDCFAALFHIDPAPVAAPIA
jgi:putative sterol carrier protein